ncbi:MAG TPA: PIG-L family deacetylase [Pyrinomonadaceae bacterium]|nr:PIG-L family deacetylase [Pyrinomonadaceae bacterium]
MNHKITRIGLALVFVALLITAPRAQQPTPAAQQTPDDRVALYQALLDLQNPWTVMCVAAHPDDEDGTSLIVMRRKYGAHTVSLFSTFGEGGQNAIGPELYEEMGAIRARETMAASEIQGSEPHFLGLKDFGFSKTRDEAFRFWGHEEALRRMVFEIRKLRPDVIITNHSTTSNDHGQHQATALMVVEAFDAAADPNKFPEQLKDGVTTWQVQRLFVRVRGNQNPAANQQLVSIDPNERDPIRGTMFAEEALNALQKHATQGPWPKSFADYIARFRAFSGQGGAAGQMPLIRYRLEREAKGAGPVPNESRNFVDGIRLPGEEASRLNPPTIDGKPLTDFIDQREKLLDALLAADTNGNAQTMSSGMMELRWYQMRGRLNAALSAVTGVSVKLLSSGQVLIPGETASLEVELSNKGKDPVHVVRAGAGLAPAGYGIAALTTSTNEVVLAPGASRKVQVPVRVPSELPVTVPHAKHLYEPTFAGVPLMAVASVELRQKKVSLSTGKFIDVAPPVDIASINPSPLVIRPDEVGVSSAGADVFPAKLPDLKIELINYRDQRFNGEVVFGLKDQGQQTSRKIELLPHQIATLALPMPRPEKTVAAHIRSSVAPELISVTVRATNSRENITTREVPIVRANAHVARNLRIGYVRGFDFSLPNALIALGVESKELSADEVKTADLSMFTSFIVDNRVYESQPELIEANQKLLDYANAGGNLIVFYHKSDEWNPNPGRNRPQLAPYKLILGNERITDENAPITFLEADHPLLNVPNKLNQDDFKDWIQERGLYYPREWDPQFHALLQSNDPGEAPLKGGLLVADYGRGHYIYTSMVWYRELRAGVPGAYRMLANMISYGR